MCEFRCVISRKIYTRIFFLLKTRPSSLTNLRTSYMIDGIRSELSPSPLQWVQQWPCYSFAEKVLFLKSIMKHYGEQQVEIRGERIPEWYTRCFFVFFFLKPASSSISFIHWCSLTHDTIVDMRYSEAAKVDGDSVRTTIIGVFIKSALCSLL